MKAKYDFKSENTRLIKSLRMSITGKKKSGWSREVGVGFVKDDIKSIHYLNDYSKKLLIRFNWNAVLLVFIDELNLRETEEALNFLLEQQNGGGLKCNSE